jgi:hypothetical protein
MGLFRSFARRAAVAGAALGLIAGLALAAPAGPAPAAAQMGPCTGVTLTADPASPQPLGTTVRFTGRAEGCVLAQYRFFLQSEHTGEWELARDYGGAVFEWDTAGQRAGTYYVGVHVRRVGSEDDSQANATIVYGLQEMAPVTSAMPAAPQPSPAPAAATTTAAASPAPAMTAAAAATPCTGTVLTPTYPSPQRERGSILTFTATTSGCENPEFRWIVLAPGASDWVTVQDFGDATLSWDTSALNAGSYAIGVVARTRGTTGAGSGNASVQYQLTRPPNPVCTRVTIDATLPPPRRANDPPWLAPDMRYTFTAKAEGCQTPEFEWIVQRPDSGDRWIPLRAWGTGNTYVLDTRGLPFGAYNLAVKARRAGEESTGETTALVTFLVRPVTWPVDVGVEPD